MSGYTPEQLREWADDWEKDAAGDTENWRRTVYLSHAAQLRAHATTLEQLSAAQAERDEFKRLFLGDDPSMGDTAVYRRELVKLVVKGREQYKTERDEAIKHGEAILKEYRNSWYDGDEDEYEYSDDADDEYWLGKET